MSKHVRTDYNLNAQEALLPYEKYLNYMGETMPEDTAAAVETLPPILLMRDIQDYLKVSRATAYDLARRPDFPVLRLGRSFRVPTRAFLEWVDKNTGGEEGGSREREV